MADLSSNPIEGLYPQPNQNQNLANNPLQLLSTISQLNQNALFQRQFKATQAVGNALQSGIQPDGSFDPSTAMKAIASSPAAAPMAGEGISHALAARGANIDNATKQFALTAGQSQTAASAIGPLINDPNPTYAKLLNLAPTLARAGVPGAMINGFIAGAPRDSAGLKTYLANINNMAAGPVASGSRVEGPPTSSGAPSSITSGQAIHLGAGGGSITSPPTASGVPAVASAPGIATGMSPGQNEAQKNVGSASGAQLATDLANANNYRRTAYPLEQAIPAMEKLGPTGTGPGTDTFNNVKSFIQSLGIPGFDPDKITNYDIANKYMTDFVNQTGNTGTNDKLAAAFAGNPSTKISNAAAVDVLKSALSLRRMQQGQTWAWQQAQLADPNLHDDQYSKWASQWQAKQDPRAYGYDLITDPKNQAALLQSLRSAKDNGASYQKFKDSFATAHGAQLLGPPPGTQSGQ